MHLKIMFNSVKKVFYWICFILPIVIIIISVITIANNQINRNRLVHNACIAEATITRIGKPTRAGKAVYYEYLADESVYHGRDWPGDKYVIEFHVGEKITIVYEKGRPTNNMIVTPSRYDELDLQCDCK